MADKKIPEGDRDSIPLSSYSPPPFRVNDPSIQTSPPDNLSQHSIPSKETFPESDKKRM